eukprot:10433157-Prorocentrum_lima.AAC.1
MSDPAHKNRVEVELGHKEYILNGVRGVLIPDAPVTRIVFNEKTGAEMKETQPDNPGLCTTTEE